MDKETVQKYSFWEFKGEYDYVDQWFLMSTPMQILTIWIAYLAFVLKIGPEFMKKRAPYNLNNILVLYNTIQIFISCFVFYILLPFVFIIHDKMYNKHIWDINYSCKKGISLLLRNGLILQRKCLTDSEELQFDTTAGIQYYFIAKITELLETVFFVLRKKERQVTFLHVYHHSTMLLCSWYTLKYEPSYSTVFLGTLNSFIHIIMYTYYGLSAFPNLTKYLWWKKYLTSMQLIQFLIITIQAVVSYKVSSCRTSYALLSLIIFNALLFMYLFGDFYVRSYIKNKQDISKSRREKSYGTGTTYVNGTNGIHQKRS